MITIKPGIDYSIREFAEIEAAEELIQKIGEITANEVMLNLDRCFVDYPGVSLVVDYILTELSKRGGEKRLEIIIPYYVESATLINSIFLGSRIFGLEETFSLPYEDIFNKVAPVISDWNIKININGFLSSNIANTITIDIP